MRKSYESLFKATVGIIAVIAVAYTVVSEVSVPVWSVLAFIAITCLVGMLSDRDKKIEIKYFDDEISPIKKFSVGDWIDLRAAETIELKSGDYYVIRLGVGMILPAGYEAYVLPRSSTAERFGIVCANSMGVIDNSYSGDADEWRFPAIAIRDTTIEKGDRIAQFRIIENQPRVRFKPVERLLDISRGGIGSTGKR